MKQQFFIVLFIFFTCHAGMAQVNITKLRCEMSVNPQGIGVAVPRFSWQLESPLQNVNQMSYEIMVSSSEEKLRTNQADIWHSGKINSSVSHLVPYAGKPLQSCRIYYWKVRSTTNKGEGHLGEAAFFSTGLLEAKDWKAKWIGYDKASKWDSITQWSRLSARYLRKEFQNPGLVKRATAYISGLGMYELYINGNKIGDQVLAPNPTDYRKSYFYNTHDVTAQVKKGANAIATVLGNGRFFTMRQNYKTQKHNTFGYPKLLLQLELEYADGTKRIITSDQSWKLNVDGPIRTNNEYDGEEYDARKELGDWTRPGFNDSKWMKPQLVSAPPGKILAQFSPSMKVKQTILPVSIKKAAPGKYILDMGQNFSGWIKLKSVSGKRGDKITMRFAESLQGNGELFTANLRDAKVTDIYTFSNTPLGPGGWEPSFIYHGFRYVEVTGFPGEPSTKNFEGKFVYDDIETTGSFQTSDETINAIYKNAWWGIASNYKGMPVDCPQRNERQPWLGDRVAGAQGESFVFDNANLYAKWVDDIQQSQRPDGAIPDVAPAFWNYYSDNVTWPAAFITISNNLYNQFGDVTPIRKNYASMKKWMRYMKDNYMVNYILTKDKYGDWCVPPESLELIHAKDSSRLTDGKLIATAYYFKLLSYMQRFAGLTGNTEDVKGYSLLADSIRNAFQKTYFNPQKQYYSNNTVTANLLPLYFGICPDSLREIVAEKIKDKILLDNNGHISTGLIGAQWLMRGLTEYGFTDIAYKLTSQRTYPSWGYMVANGATTIWELWNGNTANPAMNSQNHVMMLGDLLTWYYENLGGIRTDKTSVGFKKIIMRPTFPRDLAFVNASYKSAHGMIGSHWKKEKEVLEWNITIPANTSATVYIPAQNIESITEAGGPLSETEGLKIIKLENNNAIVQVPSGSYQFKSVIK
jgi:alpha-L-rhamnosidase